MDKKRLAGPKTSPTQPYRGLFDKQKKLHRRLPAQELDSSAGLDRREAASRSKGRLDAFDGQRQDPAKQTLSRLLKVKQRQALNGRSEASQERLGQPREQLQSRERQPADRKPSTVRELTNQAKFHSLISVAPTTKAVSAACRQPQPLLPVAQSRQQPVQPEAQKQKQLGQRFQHLRLQLDEQRLEEDALRPGETGRPAALENELDPAAESRALQRQCLRREFDLPFTWEFLLGRDVRSAD